MSKSPTEFAKTYPTFWSDKTGKALRGDGEAQAIQHYLIGNAHHNMWGLYYLPKAYITHDTGHSEKVINRVLKKLRDLEFAYYDDETEYVFIVEMAHIQVGQLKRATEEKKADLRIGSANKFYETLPDNPFLEMFHTRYKDELCLSVEVRGFKGASKGLGRSITFSSTATATASADSDASFSSPNSSLKDSEEKIDTKSKNSVPQLRRFTDLAQNLVDLWNELVAPLGLSHVDRLSESREKKIFKAYKNVESRDEWIAILGEYRISLFLQGKVGAEGHGAKDFDWMLSNGKDNTENYLKVQAGRYRDKKTNGLSDRTQGNLQAAQEVLAKRERQRQEALIDGSTRGTDLSGSTLTLSRGDWHTLEPDEAGDLPGGSADIPTGEGDGGVGMGAGEYADVSDDPGFTEAD